MNVGRTVAVLFLLSSSAGVALGAVHRIRSDGGGDFPSIQEAVTTAASGDTILLADGTYAGPGNRDIQVGPKVLTIRSASGDPARCTIDCGSLGRGFEFSAERAHESGSPRQGMSRLEGITIMKGRAQTGGAILCGPHASTVISRCVLRGNRADEEGGAVHCELTDQPRFIDCVIAGNSAGKSGGAVYVCCCGAAILENCTVISNAAPEGSAFTCVGPSHLDATRTIIAFHGEGNLIRCGKVAAPTLKSCDLYGNAGGDSVPCVKPTGAEGNISVDPGFRDREGMDFRLAPGSPLEGSGIGARRE